MSNDSTSFFLPHASKQVANRNADGTGQNPAAPGTDHTSSLPVLVRRGQPSNTTDSSATLLSHRIRQKQLKLQALREHARKCPSRFSEEITSAPPGRIPATPSAWTPRPSHGGKLACSTEPSLKNPELQGSQSARERERPCSDPKPWGRAVTSNFDPARCRALQAEWASVHATSKEALEIEAKAKRLDKLPTLKASPEAARALTALARNHEPQQFALPRHFTFQQQAPLQPNPATTPGGDKKFNSIPRHPEDSISMNNKDSDSPFEYWGLYIYLLIIVNTMGLFLSPDPLGEFIQGCQLLNSLLWNLVQFGRIAYHHCTPWMQVATLRCQYTLHETYILCSHIWIAFHGVIGEAKRRQTERGMITEKFISISSAKGSTIELIELLGYDLASLRDARLETVDQLSQTLHIAPQTFNLTLGNKAFRKKKNGSLDLCKRVPIDDRYTFVQNHDTSLEDIMYASTWQTVLDSFPTENQLRQENAPYLNGTGAAEPLASTETGLELSKNISTPSLIWSVTSLDAPENEPIGELFDQVIDSYSVQAGQWLKALRNDHVRGIQDLVRGANWITVGSVVDAS